MNHCRIFESEKKIFHGMMLKFCLNKNLHPVAIEKLIRTQYFKDSPGNKPFFDKATQASFDDLCKQFAIMNKII